MPSWWQRKRPTCAARLRRNSAGPALQALFAASEQAMEHLMALSVLSTMVGLRAMARVAIVTAPCDLDGAVMPQRMRLLLNQPAVYASWLMKQLSGSTEDVK